MYNREQRTDYRGQKILNAEVGKRKTGKFTTERPGKSRKI